VTRVALGHSVRELGDDSIIEQVVEFDETEISVLVSMIDLGQLTFLAFPVLEQT
jgi:hypothetical protein